MVYDLKRDYSFECIPTVVIKLLKYSFKAKLKNITYLPQFQSFRRVHSEVTLNVGKLPVMLRDVLNNRARVASKCNYLIKGVLSLLYKLQEDQLVLRNISPMTLFFDTDFTTAMCSDIRRIGKPEVGEKNYSHSPIPYASDLFEELKW